MGLTTGVTKHDRVIKRDQKRRDTRERLATAARHLFIEQGFAAVTLTQIGAAAGLSAKTVASYFPVKEDLYFADASPVDDRLVHTVQNRLPGESAYQAVRHALRASERFPGLARAVRERAAGETVYEAIERYRSRPWPTDAAAVKEVAAQAKVYLDSEQLRAYVDGQFARQERALAQVLVADTAAAPGDPRPGVAAAVLLAPPRWVFTVSQELLAAGHPPDEVGKRRQQDLDRAYDLLGPELANYARRSPEDTWGDTGDTRGDEGG